MSGGHDHDHDHDEKVRAPARLRWVLAAILVPLMVAIGVGIALTWPKPVTIDKNSDLAQQAELFDATAVNVQTVTCGGSIQCQNIEIELSEGPEAGQRLTIPQVPLGGSVPTIHTGDGIVVGRSLVPESGPSYSFAGLQRTASLVVLALLFGVAVVGVARWRGAAAIGGLVVAYFVLLRYLIPALLDGKNPTVVALVSSGLIMVVALYLAHGLNTRTTTALIGTLVSLTLTGILAAAFVGVSKFSSYGSDEAIYLKGALGQIDLQGIFLAGVIIGSLGVLNDVTITQASAVWEIHAAHPGRPFTSVFRSGMRVGRDHIASTVYTLVLAYVGAALPLLLLFSVGSFRLNRIITGNLVATEIVRTMVGSIGLVASVPLTTVIGAWIVTRASGRHPESGSGAAAEGEPSEADGSAASSEEVSSEPAKRVDVQAIRAARREQREARKESRREREAKEWRRPKAERELWGEEAFEAKTDSAERSEG